MTVNIRTAAGLIGVLLAGSVALLGAGGALAQHQPGHDMAHDDVGRHFIEQMIPHHEDAVAMSDLALAQSEHQEIRTLAAHIKQVQTDEIALMRQWYQDWYGTEVPAASIGGSMHGMSIHEATSIDGARPFDKAFVEQMIPHHQMAVMMSTMARQGVAQPELRALLDSIVTSQSAEIEQMRGWYQAWYGMPVAGSAPAGRQSMGGMSGHQMTGSMRGHHMGGGHPMQGGSRDHQASGMSGH